jgi:type IV pilus assembly protein PilA
MHRQRGFTLIELMIVVVVIGFLAVIAQPLFASMTNRAKVARVRANMKLVQMTAEDFSTRNGGIYPANAASTTLEGGKTFSALLPGATMPDNPFTGAATNLDWSNALGTAPATDPAGGVALNVAQSIVGGVFDTYEIIGTDDTGTTLATALTNQ